VVNKLIQSNSKVLSYSTYKQEQTLSEIIDPKKN